MAKWATGATPDGLVAIETGEIGITMPPTDAGQVVAGMLGAAVLIGPVRVLDDAEGRPEDLRTVTPTTLAIVPGDDGTHVLVFGFGSALLGLSIDTPDLAVMAETFAQAASSGEAKH